MDEEHERILEIRRRVKKERELKEIKPINALKNVYKIIEPIKNNKVLLFSIIIVILLGIVATGYFGSDTYKSKKVAENMLNEWKMGESGIRYWNDLVDKNRLYNVKSYEHILVKKMPKYEWAYIDTTRVNFDDVIMHRFRIISTNKGGMQIEKFWNIYLSKRAPYYYSFKFENVQSGWKVIDISEGDS